MTLPRARPRKVEDGIQAGIVAFLKTVLPATDYIVYANANAAPRTKGGKASNGVPGLLPGVFDLTVMGRGGVVIMFEVKGPKGALSKAQEEMKTRYIAMGVRYAVVRSIDDIRMALFSWGIKTRETPTSRFAP